MTKQRWVEIREEGFPIKVNFDKDGLALENVDETPEQDKLVYPAPFCSKMFEADSAVLNNKLLLSKA